MDKRDERDKGDRVLPHSELTERILGCAFAVSNEIGAGFLESVYENALKIALWEFGLVVRQQAPIDVYFRGQPVGEFLPTYWLKTGS